MARILGWSLLAAALGAGLGRALFGQNSDYVIPALMLGCVGGIVGAVAGAAVEIAGAVRESRGVGPTGGQEEAP